jgi:hypothetical protein
LSFRPTTCALCGKPLPISRGTGRPRRFCSAKCRYEARHRRARVVNAGEPIAIPEAPSRDELAASLTFLVDPAAPPAAPEDQLARALLELRMVEGSLRRLGPELPPRLAGPTGKLANALDRELRRSFPEVVNA